MASTVGSTPQIVQHRAQNDAGNDELPPPALSPTSSHHSHQRRAPLILSQSRWTSFKNAIKKGTGYATKPMEWSSSLLNLSDHENSTNEDLDGVLLDEDLTWLSGQNGEDSLALLLVERDHSTASQASPHLTASQENLTKQPGSNSANKTEVAQDHTYRLKAYEPSVPDVQFSAKTPIAWIRYRAFPWLKKAVLRYLYPEFSDITVEARYSERVYNSQKFLAFVCSIYLVISWVIALTLLRLPEISDMIFYWGLAPALTVPLPFMIFYDVPRRFPYFYQPFLLVSIWSWSAYLITFMQLCRYYGGPNASFSCRGRDMMNLFYYMIALPVIALFGMGQQRLYATIAPIIMIVTPSVLFIPRKHAWIRFALEHSFLQILLLYIHWRREILERSVYFANKKVRDMLVALHHTRLHQSRVEAARARSTSYIFHEVRQPLSAAYLAYQNLAASITIRPEHRFEWDVLRIKLVSMSKLLNDVLDQKRMDAGKFEIISRPFAFHQVVRQALFGCRMAMDQKQQEMILELDQNIDATARVALYQAQGKSEEEAYKVLSTSPAEDGVVSGDETRLTQVLTNLVNNATKFTPQHGKIRIKTHLVSPVPRRSSLTLSPSSHTRTYSRLLSTPASGKAQSSSGLAVNSWEDDANRLVVRIEVTDTGCGISPSDVKERALFSPYAQAGIGRLQGGSGTGLGVSLVRRIVKLMGGRMGVESLFGAGSTFWVEFPLRFAAVKDLQRGAFPPPLLSSPVSSYTSAGTNTRVESTPGSVVATHSTPPSLSPVERARDPLTTPGVDVPTPTQPKVGTGLSILVVDDDVVLRGLLQRLLQRLGCRVETAENGKIALQKLGVEDGRINGPRTTFSLSTDDVDASPINDPPRSPSNYYDVVFMDNQMPVTSGQEAVATLRQANRHDFVVGLTGDADPVSQGRFKQAGADEVLSKPVHESQLKLILEKARDHTPREHQPP
ncbi:hypothetical protein FRC16_011292 [Serendipita sp. 398]|nr:hypothetical protein FRC16_011292 [Serendipita sp. 398]